MGGVWSIKMKRNSLDQQQAEIYSIVTATDSIGVTFRPNRTHVLQVKTKPMKYLQILSDPAL